MSPIAETKGLELAKIAMAQALRATCEQGPRHSRLDVRASVHMIRKARVQGEFVQSEECCVF